MADRNHYDHAMKATTFRLVAIPLLFAAAAATAQTKYFQCTDANGNRVFSQTNCGQDAEEGSINSAATMATMKSQAAPAEPQPEVVTATAAETEPAVAPPVEDTEARRLETMAELQALDQERLAAQRKLASYERQREVSLKLLDDKLGTDTAADPNDAWARILLEEKRKVQERYNPLISQEQDLVDALSLKIQSLQSALPGQ